MTDLDFPMRFKGKMKILAQFILKLNEKQINSEAYASILVTLSFLIMFTSNRLENKNLSNGDSNIFTAIQYTNFTNIFLNGFGWSSKILSYVILGFHVIVLFSYTLATMIKSENRLMILFESSLAIIQQAYLWMLFLPSITGAWIALGEFNWDITVIIVSSVSSILSLIYAFLLSYINVELDYTSRMVLGLVKNSILSAKVVGELILSIFYAVAYFTGSVALMPPINFAVSILLIWYYIADLPFMNSFISRLFCRYCVIYAYWSGLFILSATASVDLSDAGLTINMIIGVFFSIKFADIVKENLDHHIIFSKDYISLSTSHFERLVRMVLGYLEGTSIQTISDKKAASYYLICFLTNHILSCTLATCECKTIDNLDDSSIPNQVLLEKSIAVNKYRDLTIKVIDDLYDRRIHSRKWSAELELYHIQFTNQWLDNPKVAFLKISKLHQKLRFNLSLKHEILLIYKRQRLLQKFEEMYSENKTDVIPLKTAVEFKLYMDKWRDKMADCAEMYLSFYQNLCLQTIDLDKILELSNNIKKAKALLFEMTHKMLKAPAKNHELVKLIYQAINLNVLDSSFTKDLERHRFEHSKQSTKIHSKLKSDYDAFDSQSCVIFIPLNGKSLDRVKFCSTTIKSLFGYEDSELERLRLHDLMPDVFAEKHQNYLKDFIQDRASVNRINYFLEDVFAKDKQGFVFLVDVYFRVEVMRDEVYLAGCIIKHPDASESILFSHFGQILNHSEGLKETLKLQMIMKNTTINNIMESSPEMYINFFNYAFTESSHRVILQSEDAFAHEEQARSGALETKAKQITFIIPKSKITHQHKLLISSEFFSLQQVATIRDTNANSANEKKRILNLIRSLQHSYSFYTSQNILIFNARVSLKSMSYRNNDISFYYMKVQEVNEVPESEINSYLIRCQDLFEQAKRRSNFFSASFSIKHSGLTLEKNKNATFDEELECSSCFEEEIEKSSEIVRYITKKSTGLSKISPIVGKISLASNLSHRNRSEFDRIIFGKLNDEVILNSKKTHMILPRLSSNKNLERETRITVPTVIQTKQINDPGETSIISQLCANQQRANIPFDSKRVHEKVDVMSNFVGSSSPFNQVSKETERFERNHHEMSIPSTSTATHKSGSNNMIRQKLDDTSAPSGLIKLNALSILSISIVLTMIILLFVLLCPSLLEYHFLVLHADYPNNLANSMSVFATWLEAFEVIQLQLFNSSVNTSALVEFANVAMNESYIRYQTTYAYSVGGIDVTGYVPNFSYDDFTINLWELNADQTASTYTMEYYVAVQYLQEMMNKMQGKTAAAVVDDSDNVFTLERNIANLFELLFAVMDCLMGEVYGKNATINIQSAAQTMLIVSLCTLLFFLALMYPMFLYQSNLKVQGLSLLASFDTSALETIIRDYKQLLIALREKKKLEADDFKMAKTIKTDQIYHSKKKFRSWKKKHVHPLLVIFALIIIFGVLSIYFIISALRVIQHDKNFIPLYIEFDMLTDVQSCFLSSYYSVLATATLYNKSQIIQDSFPDDSYQLFSTYDVRMSKGQTILDNIDQILSGNADITAPYRTMEIEMERGNLCDFIADQGLTDSQMNQCKTAFQGVTHLGLSEFFTKVINYNIDTVNYLNASNFSVAQSIEVVNRDGFTDFLSLNYYGDLIFNKYTVIIRQNMEDILQAQIYESIIFLVLGLFGFTLIFLAGWIPFFNLLNRQLIVVKEAYCLLPLEWVKQHRGIAKWLTTHSKTTSDS